MFNARQEKNVGVRIVTCGEQFPMLLLLGRVLHIVHRLLLRVFHNVHLLLLRVFRIVHLLLLRMMVHYLLLLRMRIRDVSELRMRISDVSDLRMRITDVSELLQSDGFFRSHSFQLDLSRHPVTSVSLLANSLPLASNSFILFLCDFQIMCKPISFNPCRVATPGYLG